MKKLLLLLFLIPNLVMAEYEDWAGPEDPQNMFFVDMESLQLINRKYLIFRIKIYTNTKELFAHAGKDDDGFNGSVASLLELHCNEKKFKTLNRLAWSEPDLKGAFLLDIPGSKDWQFRSKTSLFGGFVEEVCVITKNAFIRIK